MKIGTYYLSQLGRPLCASCAEQSELDSGRPLTERQNDTGGVLECVECGEDIPIAQTYRARSSMSVSNWNSVLGA